MVPDTAQLGNSTPSISFEGEPLTDINYDNTWLLDYPGIGNSVSNPVSNDYCSRENTTPFVRNVTNKQTNHYIRVNGGNGTYFRIDCQPYKQASGNFRTYDVRSQPSRMNRMYAFGGYSDLYKGFTIYVIGDSGQINITVNETDATEMYKKIVAHHKHFERNSNDIELLIKYGYADGSDGIYFSYIDTNGSQNPYSIYQRGSSLKYDFSYPNTYYIEQATHIRENFECNYKVLDL
jgi:hypothetical protein